MIKPKLNHQIRSFEVRITVGPETGVMTHTKAMALADSLGEDLIEISGGATPPVCIIADLGKWKYDQAKKAKASAQVILETKTVQIRPVTEENDRETKARQIRKFLSEGHRVSLLVKFRGREMAHPGEGIEALQDMISRVTEEGSLEGSIGGLEGKQISCMIAPRKK